MSLFTGIRKKCLSGHFNFSKLLTLIVELICFVWWKQQKKQNLIFVQTHYSNNSFEHSQKATVGFQCIVTLSRSFILRTLYSIGCVTLTQIFIQNAAFFQVVIMSPFQIYQTLNSKLHSAHENSALTVALLTVVILQFIKSKLHKGCNFADIIFIFKFTAKG